MTLSFFFNCGFFDFIRCMGSDSHKPSIGIHHVVHYNQVVINGASGDYSIRVNIILVV